MIFSERGDARFFTLDYCYKNNSANFSLKLLDDFLTFLYEYSGDLYEKMSKISAWLFL